MMFPPRWFLPYDAMFQLVTGLISLAVAIYALRGYRWIKERTLYALFWAFTMLSAALFINSVTLAYTYLVGFSYGHHARDASGADLGFWIYYIISILALIVLVYAYASRLRDASLVLAAIGLAAQRMVGGSLLGAAPYMEIVVIALLVIIVIAQAAHLSVKRSVYSIAVTWSFLLLLLSHVIILLSPVEDVVHVVGRAVELFGFLSLLGVLYLLRRGR